MYKIFITIICALFISSCGSSKLMPLKGKYPDTPYQVKTSKSFEQVWDNLVDLFAQKGLSIKIIDKSSGLITSDKAILTRTIENKDGSLQNPAAFIVVPQIYEPGPMRYVALAYDSDIFGEWNVRIKEFNGETIINVNIVNVQYSYYDPSTKLTKQAFITTYKSTGVFEKLITDLIK